MSEQVFRPTTTPVSGRVTPASFPFYTTGEDNLRVTSYNSATGVSLKINGRLIDAAGRANSDSWDHTPNTDRSAKTTNLTLSGSTLLNLTVFASAGSPKVGQTFVIVQLIRGEGAGALVLGTILQGYVTTGQAIGWPGSPIVTSTDGEPLIRVIAGTTPALSAEVSETVPTGARWELLSFGAFLTPGVGFANRQPMLVGQLGGTIVAQSISGTVVVPPNLISYNWQAGFGTPTVSVPPYSCDPFMAGLRLPAGGVIRTATFGLAIGDQWSNVGYCVREWLEGS